MAHLKTLAALTTIVRRLIDEPTVARWSAAQVTAAINEAKDRVYSAVRRMRADYFYKTMESDDGAQTVLGESYAASSMAVTVGGTTLTLPPDVAEVKLIEVITSNYEDVRWRHLDLTHPYFRNALAETSNQEPTEFLWDLVAARTIRYAPKSNTALDIRLHYIYQPADLTTGSELDMPYPLELAVCYYACASLLLQDQAQEAAVFEQRALAVVEEVVGSVQRQFQDSVVVAGMFEDM
jgi:hypothetical protein